MTLGSDAMPELAEVAYYASRWRRGLQQPILRVDLHPRARVFRDCPFPEQLAKKLEGLALTEIRTHGKQMLFRFGENVHLLGHLGMSGQLSLANSTHVQGRHDHLVLRQAARSLVFEDPRMFGSWRIWEDGLPEVWANLPPEIGSRQFTKPLVAGALARHARAPIKAVLLRQEYFPGIGNWMADEVLWRARILPGELAGKVDTASLAVLWKKLREVCRDAIRVIAPDWADPPDSWLFSHRWEPGGHCPSCGLGLERADIGGRTTAWCGQCQRRGVRAEE